MRRMLLFILWLGVVGTMTELLLLEHYEDRAQLVPLAMFALSLAVIAWHGLSRGPASVRALQVVMGLFVASGALGIYLHYRGNVEFELEMYPDRHGFELFRESMTGATPALAPGTMVLLGLIGLVYTHQHPLLPSRSQERRAEPSARALTREVDEDRTCFLED
jgi:hypothetical protein